MAIRDREIIIGIFVILGLLLLGIGTWIGFNPIGLMKLFAVVTAGSLFFIWKYYTNKAWLRWIILIGIALSAIWMFFMPIQVLFGIAVQTIVGIFLLVAALVLILKYM